VVTGYLLDVNVLIALVYEDHEFHERAEDWFFAHAVDDWVTCPTTENGAIRVVAGPRFPGHFTHAGVASKLLTFAVSSGHRFIPDNISLLNDPAVDLDAVGTSARLTDTYLLSLAVHENLMLATMDGRLDPSAVVNGDKHLHIIPDGSD
jgi:predicted nucleic acid-binding protein